MFLKFTGMFTSDGNSVWESSDGTLFEQVDGGGGAAFGDGVLGSLLSALLAPLVILAFLGFVNGLFTAFRSETHTVLLLLSVVWLLYYAMAVVENRELKVPVVIRAYVSVVYMLGLFNFLIFRAMHTLDFGFLTLLEDPYYFNIAAGVGGFIGLFFIEAPKSEKATAIPLIVLANYLLGRLVPYYIIIPACIIAIRWVLKNHRDPYSIFKTEVALINKSVVDSDKRYGTKEESEEGKKAWRDVELLLEKHTDVSSAYIAIRDLPNGKGSYYARMLGIKQGLPKLMNYGLIHKAYGRKVHI